MLKLLSAVLALGGVALTAPQVAAQQLAYPPSPAAPVTRPMTPPETNFYAPALAQGRQLVGLGGKCLTAQSLTRGAAIVMQPCAFNLVSQRFVVDGNKLRLATVITMEVPNPQPKPPNAPAHVVWPAMVKVNGTACLTANDAGDMRLDQCAGRSINPAHQNWVPTTNGGNGTVNSGPFCLDVANSNRNDGAKVIAYRCNWGQNQEFRLAQASGAAVPSN